MSSSPTFLTLHLFHLSLCHPVQVVVMVILWMIWLCLTVQLCLSKRIRPCSSIAGRFPTPPATSATAGGERSTAQPVTALSAWTCWTTTPSPSAIPMYDTLHALVSTVNHAFTTLFSYWCLCCRSLQQFSVRCGWEMWSMLIIRVSLWLLMLLPATNSTSAWNGGALIFAVCMPRHIYAAQSNHVVFSKLMCFWVFFCVAFVCPGNLRYQACLPACTAPSCPNQEFEFVPEQCTGLSEGCVCPEGTLLHRPYSALCIPPSKCGMTLVFLFLSLSTQKCSDYWETLLIFEIDTKTNSSAEMKCISPSMLFT